jgi:hypothetical protein
VANDKAACGFKWDLTRLRRHDNDVFTTDRHDTMTISMLRRLARIVNIAKEVLSASQMA